jgi:hypothetical protein
LSSLEVIYKNVPELISIGIMQDSDVSMADAEIYSDDK